MSLAALLDPRDSESPSGPDLEYDAEFAALERAARPIGERQIGGEITPAEEPDYRVVREKAISVLEKSHDLRASVWLAQAELNLGGFEGFAPAIELTHAMLRQWWDSCHPMLDADDDNDPTARVNAILGLTDPETTLRGVLLAPLTQSATFGRLSLRDMLIASGEITPVAPANGVADAATVAAALRDTDTAILGARLQALQKTRQELAGINRIFDENIPSLGPDLSALDRHLRRAVSRLSEVLGEDTAQESAEGAEDVPVVAAPKPRLQSVPGEITSAADARAALDRIIAFYAENEPSSPLPILLHRARRLVGADFMTIMRDIAPHGLDSVRTLGGIAEED